MSIKKTLKSGSSCPLRTSTVGLSFILHQKTDEEKLSNSFIPLLESLLMQRHPDF